MLIDIPFFREERPLADDIMHAVQKAVNPLESEVGHAEMVGVGINKDDTQLSTGVFIERAFLAG